jgi:hypothetical protein
MPREVDGYMTEREFNEYKRIYNIPYNFEDKDAILADNGLDVGKTILVQDYFVSNFENGQRGKKTYIATIIGVNDWTGNYGNYSGLSANTFKIFLNEYVPTRIVGTQRYGIIKINILISEGVLGARETSNYYEPGSTISGTGLSDTTLIVLPNYNPPETRVVKGIRINPVRTPENIMALEDIDQERERQRERQGQRQINRGPDSESDSDSDSDSDLDSDSDSESDLTESSEEEVAPVIQRRSARATAVRQQVEPIKTIEVPEALKFYDILMLEEILESECHENGGIAFVLQTNNGQYVTECMSINHIQSINQRRESELGNEYIRLEIQGGSYNVKKIGWLKNINSLNINNVPQPRTFYLEKINELVNGVQTYKLVKLNIVVKQSVPLVAQAEEQRNKPNLEGPSNKRTRKGGRKHLKKTNKKRKKINKKTNKRKSIKVRR